MDEAQKQALIAALKEAIAEKTKATDALVVEISTKLDANAAVSDNLKSALETATAENQKLHGRLTELEQIVVATKGKSRPEREKTAGQIVVESPELKEFVARGGKGHSSPVRIKTITSVEGNSAGAGIWSQRLPGVIEEPLRPLSVRDLLDKGTTTSNLIEWVKELLFTNNADVVSEGGQKPQSNITYEREDVPVRTIAHWIRATRQVLADFPQLQTLINGRLAYGLKIVEEDQILLGDGVGTNILGLIPQATAYDTSLNNSNDTFIDVIRHAILQVRLSFYPSTGIVLNPVDWHTIELTKDSQNRYLMANPAGTLPPMLWGRPVVESDAMGVDEFLVGAFRLAATLFDREESQIFISTEDQDNFVKNLVTILCEERIALAVSRPAAFVHGGFPADSTT